MNESLFEFLQIKLLNCQTSSRRKPEKAYAECQAKAN